MTMHPIRTRIKKCATTGFAMIFIFTILIITIPAAYLWLPANVKYHIVEKHTISIPEDRARVNIGFILPKSGSYQTVNNPRIEWGGEQEWISYAHLDAGKLWAELEENHPQQMIIEYDVTLQQGITAWKSPVDQKFTLPQTGIESDHNAIINRAQGLLNDPYRIYQFTSRHLVFTEEDCGETNTSALEAYRLATGSCLGYSRLMVALCRAAGIPARMIIGTVLPDDYYPMSHRGTADSPGIGHAWIEYYAQGNWHTADPSWGQGYLDFLEYNHSDGLHLSYGEYDDFHKVREGLFHWATRQSFINLDELTYIIASSKDSISVNTEIAINKKWDGRWINTLLVFAIVTFLLCKFRDLIFLRRDHEQNQI